MSYRPLAPVLRRAHCRTDSSPGCTCTGSGVSREGTPYYIILAVVPRRRRRRGSTTRSRTARRTPAVCGTRGRCRSAAARGPTPSTRAPSSSTPGHCQSDVATTDSSTTAPGCRRLQVSTSKCDLITPRRLVARRQKRNKKEKPVFCLKGGLPPSHTVPVRIGDASSVEPERG